MFISNNTNKRITKIPVQYIHSVFIDNISPSVPNVVKTMPIDKTNIILEYASNFFL